mgnify:CR=1 FL=1
MLSVELNELMAKIHFISLDFRTQGGFGEICLKLQLKVSSENFLNLLTIEELLLILEMFKVCLPQGRHCEMSFLILHAVVVAELS